MSIYRIKMNGKTYEMEINLLEDEQPKKGKTQKDTTTFNSASQEPTVCKTPTEISSNTVVAPMPGNIIQILAQTGDVVQKNENVLILEAMKMENEICVPRAGKIKAVFVSEGQAVLADDPLFEMEAEG